MSWPKAVWTQRSIASTHTMRGWASIVACTHTHNASTHTRRQHTICAQTQAGNRPVHSACMRSCRQHNRMAGAHTNPGRIHAFRQHTQMQGAHTHAECANAWQVCRCAGNRRVHSPCTHFNSVRTQQAMYALKWQQACTLAMYALNRPVHTPERECGQGERGNRYLVQDLMSMLAEKRRRPLLLCVKRECERVSECVWVRASGGLPSSV